MDFFKNKDVEDYILATPGGLEEKYSKYIFKRILEGIQFLHSKNVCHIDIKPNNFILNDEFDPMVIDFGFSIKVEGLQRDQTNCKQKKGNEKFLSPERLDNKEQNFSGIEDDIFRLGVLLQDLVSGVFYSKKNYDNNIIENPDYKKFWKQLEKDTEDEGKEEKNEWEAEEKIKK